jgi:hypothetical protein
MKVLLGDGIGQEEMSQIQTTPSKVIDGTVLIVMDDSGSIKEVISDLQLNVITTDGSFTNSRPSRPLWEYLAKVTKFHIDSEK